ncbi:MAG: glycosyltransferase family 4 protein [Alphaproteobacteria bacterium]|nr:glycosyltransferase family 4 protein [Alphaproteobacteria bacterium]
MTADAVGGVWSYAVGLCRSLPEIRFVVATMGPPPRQTQRDAILQLENVTLVESNYRLEWMADAVVDFTDSRDWLIDLIQRHEADVVHVNGYAHAQLDDSCPVVVVAHSDVLSWWEAVHKFAAPPEWAEYRRQVMTGLAVAARIVAPTAAVLGDIERHYGALASNGVLISNGVDPAAFPALDKRPVVLAAGRLWDAAKNLVALDAAAPRLAWPVEIAGELEHPDGGAAAYAHVRLLGRLTPVEMARHLGSAGIFAAPARYEPFGLAILEAAAAGCALVLGDISSLRENWNGAARFVDSDDPRSLSTAINALVANPEERARLAAAARSRACRFTVDRMARAYAALYHDVMRSSAILETA